MLKKDYASLTKTQWIEKNGKQFQVGIEWGPQGVLNTLLYHTQRLISPNQRRLYRFYNRSPSRFWNTLQEWEEETFQIFEKYLDKNHSYIDIGAWIGPTVLYGSQLACHAWALEPDPVAYRLLYENIQLNDSLRSKITPVNACIGMKNGRVKFGRAGSVGGDSRSSLLLDQQNYWYVDSITLETLFDKYQIKDCNFIKMDIEGGEVIVLPAIKDFLQHTKISLFLSLHPLFFNNVEKDKKILLETLSIFPFIFDKHGNVLDKTSFEFWNHDCVICTFN